jgi:4-hydroxybenzoyl-CoA thioesterase/acyl-CoA thioester hydrolase
MPGPFRTTRRVEFADTDMAGIAHFSAFIRYMEEAEHALWRHLGTSIVRTDAAGQHFSWPRVAVRCEYSASATFEQVLDIDVFVERLGEKSVTYSFEFSHVGQPLAKGEMTSVFCQFVPGGRPKSLKILEEDVRKLEEFARD